MKLMKLATVVVAGMLVFGGLGGSAGAKGGKEAKTEFLDIGVNCCADLPGDKCLYSGVIDSESKKCIEGRKVKMYAFVNGGCGSSARGHRHHVGARWFRRNGHLERRLGRQVQGLEVAGRQPHLQGEEVRRRLRGRARRVRARS